MKTQLQIAYEDLKKYETRAERNLKVYETLKPLYDNNNISLQDTKKINRSIRAYNKARTDIKKTKLLIDFLKQGGMSMLNSVRV